MRQIKFRVWDNLKKEWVSNKNIWRMKTDPNGIGEIEPNAFYWKQHPQGLTIQQFTGLIDKNEKEIYEGDVLERIGNGSFCKIVVSWSDKECCFVYNNVGNLHGSPSPLHDNFVNLCDWTYWVVCGNIFENPELLK
jgi:uncharacterized phage protein (TIGR01671 family)